MENNSSVNTILIAEDEYLNYRYLYELLHSSGMKILHATNGQQAIDLCMENDEINLILMDLRMPVMDGLTASKAIKIFRPDLPIIAQTAYGLESDQFTFVKVFDDHIKKPINRKELKQMMMKYITMD